MPEWIVTVRHKENSSKLLGRLLSVAELYSSKRQPETELRGKRHCQLTAKETANQFIRLSSPLWAASFSKRNIEGEPAFAQITAACLHSAAGVSLNSAPSISNPISTLLPHCIPHGAVPVFKVGITGAREQVIPPWPAPCVMDTSLANLLLVLATARRR